MYTYVLILHIYPHLTDIVVIKAVQGAYCVPELMCCPRLARVYLFTHLVAVLVDLSSSPYILFHCVYLYEPSFVAQKIWLFPVKLEQQCHAFSRKTLVPSEFFCTAIISLRLH